MIANNTLQWPAASGGQKSNANPQFFPAASGVGWGYVVAAALFDAASAGNMLYFGTLAQARQITDGDTAQFPAGSIVVVET